MVRETIAELSEETSGVDDHYERMYFDLTGEVVDLWDDSGIVRVLAIAEDDSKGYIFCHKVSNETIDMFEALRFAKPSDENLVWYRLGTRVFVQGLNTSDIEYNSFFVDYVKRQDILAMADADIVNVTDLILPELINRVVQRGKMQLYGTQPDVANDGNDTKSTQYHRAIANPDSE